MADGQYYSCKQDLYNIFGKENIDRYADPNNDGDQKVINERLEWANATAQDYVNGRMATTKYEIPFTCPYPKTVVYIAAAYAGKLLYDTRRVVSGDDNNRIAAQQRNAEMLIQQITSGQLLLIDQNCKRLDHAKSYPISISSSYRDAQEEPEEGIIDPFKR